MESMNSAYWALGISFSLGVTVITLVYRYGLWKGAVDSDREGFRNFMAEVRADIKEILTRLPPVPVTVNSPTILTNYGMKISDTVDAKAWAKAEAGKLITQVKGKEAFEIQNVAFQYANEFEPSLDLLRKMSACAFENGTELESVRKVMGVELRDVLLKLLELQQSSLDEGLSTSSPSR